MTSQSSATRSVRNSRSAAPVVMDAADARRNVPVSTMSCALRRFFALTWTLKNTVFGINCCQEATRPQLGHRLTLALDFLEGDFQHVDLDCLRHNYYAIGIAKDQISRIDQDPSQITGTSTATTWPRPFESRGAMPTLYTGNFSARMSRMSRTKPSVMQPAPPRARVAVDRSAPQGAIRGRAATGKDRHIPQLQIIDQGDLEFVRVLVCRDMGNFGIASRAGAPAQNEAVIQRTHPR